MRILFGMVALFGLSALCGCGAPEAEFAWSEQTEELLPDARNAVKDYTLDRFGTPGEMVAWQRLPIRFGGIPGVITGTIEDYENIVTKLTVDFRVPVMMARYDENLDGLLAFSEFPGELQEAITIEKFEGADADKDGFLTSAELGRVRRVESELFVEDTVNQVTGENEQELIGKELMFVGGRFSEQSTRVKNILITEGSTEVEIWPPLNIEVEDGAAPVELAGHQIMLDFGRTMRSGRHLYMRHCMHCHGVTGDGNGPTAKYLSPLPRDYRQGTFKFISTERTTVKRPSRDDLARIMRNGIPGTYMPSFAMLKDEEVADITEYVRWLSMRGQYEGQMNLLLGEQFSNEAVNREIENRVEVYKQDVEAGLVKEGDPAVTPASVRSEIEKNLETYLTDSLPEEIDTLADEYTAEWRAAELKSNVVLPKVSKPPTTLDSIARGRHLYLSKCAVCHGVTAEGNGENTRGYQKNPATNEEYALPGFFDDWGQPIQPRNLNTGIYRGGRRPVDIYRRIHQGIPGTPMQSFSTVFKDEQIWDLVDYVMSIPIDGPVPAQTRAVAQALKPNPRQETKVAQSKESAKGTAE